MRLFSSYFLETEVLLQALSKTIPSEERVTKHTVTMAFVNYCLSVFVSLLKIVRLSFIAFIATECLNSLGSPACSELDGGSVSLSYDVDSNLRTFDACSDLDGGSESSSCHLDSKLTTFNACFELDGGSKSSSCGLDSNLLTFSACSELDCGSESSPCDLESNLMTFNASSELDGGSESSSCDLDPNLMTFNASSELDGGIESSSIDMEFDLQIKDDDDEDDDQDEVTEDEEKRKALDQPRLDNPEGLCHLFRNKLKEIDIKNQDLLQIIKEKNRKEAELNETIRQLNEELINEKTASANHLLDLHKEAELLKVKEVLAKERDSFERQLQKQMEDQKEAMERLAEEKEDVLKIREQQILEKELVIKNLVKQNEILKKNMDMMKEDLEQTRLQVILKEAELLKIEEVLAKERHLFKEAMKKLTDEKQEKENLLQIREQHISEKERVIKDLKMENEILQENIDTMQEDLEKIREQQISKDWNIEDLEDKNENLKKNMVKIQRDLERMKAEKEQRERHIKDHEVLAEEMNNAVKNLQEELKEMKQQKIWMENDKERLENKNREMETLNEELHQLRLDKSRMEHQLVEARDILGKVRKQSAEKTEKMVALEREIEDQKRLKKVASIRDNEEHLKRLEKMTALEKENESLWKGLEKMEKNHKNLLVEAQAQTELKEEEARRLALELEGQNRAIGNLQSENKKLRELVKEKRGVIDSLKREKEAPTAKMAADFERMRNECAEKEEQIKDQEMLLRTLKAEKDQMSKDLEEMKRICSEMKEQREDKEQMTFIGKGLFAYMNDLNDAAFSVFSEALANGSFTNEESALLHILRAKALAACGQPSDDLAIIADCCMAIKKGLSGWEVHQLCGEHLLKQELFGAAVEDLKIADRLKRSAETLRALNEAKEKQMKWETQSHHSALGLHQTATKPQILKAYKDLSMKYHPDRHRDKPEVLQKAFEEKFKRITNAKTILMENQQQWQHEAKFPQNGYRRNNGKQWNDQRGYRKKDEQWYEESYY
ncbi:calponin homology domain-containing protein DDB_G0272472-like [Macrobrachium nipponense]|uniref:calponin homology domain-containing protein DDB_G0272472-like n=1 Tax=Macrobrachium nipponense TaxID=159736 RepID=UPI0030C7E1C6